MSFDRLFAERLKEERLHSALTQAEMAEITEVSREMWGKYERGAALPGVAVLMAADRAGLDVLYLLTGRRKVMGVDTLGEAERQLVASYAKADQAGREALLAVARLAAGVVRVGRAGNAVTIGGDVGQSVAGDQNNAGPMSFKVGKNK